MVVQSYTKALKNYDRDLFAAHNPDGVICVYRKIKRYEPVCVTDDFKLLNLKEAREFVCALTENWTLRTLPRQWGIDRLLTRIREMDLQANERFFDEMDAQHERVDESKKRDFRNETESFLIDNRKEFAKEFDRIAGCTHSLSKDEPRKRLKDRRFKNGNY